MRDEPKHISECLPHQFTPKKLRKVLEEPFDKERIKTRIGGFGNTLSYVEGHEYIKRLNEAFDGVWSFEIISHHLFDGEVMVIANLKAGGISKMAFGGSRITKQKESDNLVSLTDDLKAAATDALKKAASLMGVGLHLYSDQNEKADARHDKKRPNGNSGNGNGNGDGHSRRLTSRQLAAIFAIAKSKHWDREDVKRMTIQMFDKTPDFLTIEEASKVIQDLQEL